MKEYWELEEGFKGQLWQMRCNIQYCCQKQNRIAELVERWCHEQVPNSGQGIIMKQIRSSSV